MYVIGFRTNIGAGRMIDDETEQQFCSDVVVSLKLTEGTEITGNDVTCTSYDNKSGMSTVMFDRPISQSLAETLLSKDDIFLFDDFDEDDLDI